MATLKGLGKYCGKINLGGIIKLEYAPLDWLDLRQYQPLLSSAYNFQTHLIFLQGSWLSMPLVNSKRLWTENQRRSRQGESYEQRVEGIVPRLSAAAAGELKETARHRYLLRLTDRHGKKWLLGTPDSPFDFESDGSSGGSGAVSGHRIRFVSETPDKAHGFEPVIVL